MNAVNSVAEPEQPGAATFRVASKLILLLVTAKRGSRLKKAQLRLQLYILGKQKGKPCSCV